MRSSSTSLFSFRTILLIIVAVCAARANADIFDPPPTPLGSGPDSHQSSELENPSFTVIEDFLPGSAPGSELDAILVPTTRSFAEDILGDVDLFLLTSNSEVTPRSWLAYLAPEGFTLDSVIQNSTVFLQSLDNPSAPGSTPSVTPHYSISVSANVEPANSPTANLPFEVFLGIDLADAQSLPIESGFGLGSTIPQFEISEFIPNQSANIPEPSSVALLLLTFASSLARRRRRS